MTFHTIIAATSSDSLTLLTTYGSILAAFFAGSVALFAPCCIVFLLPAYLASAVKNHRWSIFPLTLVFAAGLGSIILPITLGVRMLAATFQRYETPFRLAGGGLMVVLGVLAITGRSWTLPALKSTPSLQRTDSGGVFALGVFSGIATSCCAPVLAGVAALSGLSGSTTGALSLGTAYVFGMVFPLLAIALAWDRFRLGERKLLKARALTFRVAGRAFHTNTMNVIAGIAFLAMGGVVIGVALAGKSMSPPGLQVATGHWLTRAFDSVLRPLKRVPNPVLGVGLLAFAVSMMAVGIRGTRARPKEFDDGEQEWEIGDQGPDTAEGAPDLASAEAVPERAET